MKKTEDFLKKIDTDKDWRININETLSMLEDKDIFDWFVSNLNDSEFKKEFKDKFPFRDTFEKELSSGNILKNLERLISTIEDYNKTWEKPDQRTFYDMTISNLSGYLESITTYRQIRLVQLYMDFKLWNKSFDFDKILSLSNDTNVDKEKVLSNAKLARFAYADIKRIWNTNNWKVENPKDISELIDLREIFDFRWKLVKNTNNLSYHNRLLSAYIQYNLDTNANKPLNVQYELQGDRVLITDKIFTENELKYINTNIANNIDIEYSLLASIDRNISKPDLSKLQFDNRMQIVQITKDFKENSKSQETPQERQSLLKYVTNNYDILWKYEKSSSWYSCILIQEKKEPKEKYLLVRWSDWLTDWIFNNLLIWLSIFLWTKILPPQVKSLKLSIDEFKEKWLIKEWEKINIVGHSLWWALSEISDIKYTEIVNKSYSYNWPWVRDLFTQIPEWAWDKVIKVKNHDTIWNLGTQIATYTVPVEWTEHSIKTLIELIEAQNEIIIINKNAFRRKEVLAP